MDKGEVDIKRTSRDTEEMATVLNSMEAATVLAGGIDIPTGSVTIPTAGPPVVDIHTGSDVVPIASPIVAIATVVTPYSRRNGKEVMVESDTPKKQSNLVKYQDNYSKIYKFQSQQRRPWTKKQKKDYYMTVIRNNLWWKVKDFKGMTFEEIKAKFAAVWKSVEDFIPMGSKEEVERLKRKGFNLEQEKAKKQKTSKEVHDKEKSLEEIPEEKVKEMMQLVPIEEVYVQALQVKHPIIDWKVHIEGQRSYWKIISEKEMELWVELKRLYESDPEDQLWAQTQNYMHAPIEWKLYNLSGVHHVTAKDKEIFMLVENDYPLRKGLALMMISYKLQVKNYSQMVEDLIWKIYNIANSPRQQVESKIPTISSPIPTVCLDISLESSSGPRHITKGDFSQKETPSLGNALTLSNRFEDTFRVEADLSNIETSIPVSPTPTFRIHKDHPKSQISGPVDTPVQTRHKSKEMEEQRVIPVGTKWVLKNKKYERGIVIRNKARLVAQGYTQEEGINYEEVFTPVASIEAIRLFLAYASFMGFIVYQMDVKSAFLYGTINEELCRELEALMHDKFQMSAMGELTFFPGLQVLPIERDSILVRRILEEKMDLDKKSTTGGCQFLRRRLISWQCKMQTIMATSTTEAEYVAAASGCGQVFWIQDQMLDYRIETTNQGTKILATFDGKTQTIFESSLRRHLKLNDEEGISSLPDTELFENLSLMGYNILPNQRFTFQKGQFSHQWKFLIHTIMQCLCPKSDGFNEFSSNIATVVVCLAINRVYNFSKMIFDGMMRNINSKGTKFLMYPRVNSLSLSGRTVPLFASMIITQGERSANPTEPHHTPSPQEQHSSHHDSPAQSNPTTTSEPLPQAPTETLTPRRYTRWAKQIAQSKALLPAADEPASLSRDDRQGEVFFTVSSLDAEQDMENIAKTSALPHESSPRVTSLDADEGSMQQIIHELMELCTSLQRQQSQMAAKIKDQDQEISELKARVKFLEDKERRSVEPTQEDAPITGGIMEIGEELGADKSTEIGSNDTKKMVNVLISMEAANILTRRGAAARVSPGDVLPTVGVPTVSRSFPTVNAIFTTASVVIPYTRRSRGITIGSSQHMGSPIIRAKDKGKQKVVETEVPKKTKLQEQIDAQVAIEIEEEFARENQRLSEQLARDSKIERLHAEEELKIMIEGLDKSNEVVAKHLKEYEQAKANLSVGEKIELISELVKYQDHHAKILKEMTLEQIKDKFIPVWKQLEDFVPMSLKEESERVKRQGLKIDQGSAKRVKTSKSVSEDVSEEELKGMMQLVPLEEVYVEALQIPHNLWCKPYNKVSFIAALNSFKVTITLQAKVVDPTLRNNNLGASINLIPLSVWKKLRLPELISTRMTLKLANQAICTPARIARDVFVPVGKFTFLADFVIIDYESDPRAPLILGRPFLRTARALIDVHGKEMILHDGDERLTLNMRHDTSSYSNQPQKESIKMINIFNDSSEDFLEILFARNHQSGNPTFSFRPNLTSQKVKDDVFDPEGGNVLIKKLLDLDYTKDLCKELLNINLPLAKIKSLNDNPTPYRMFKPPHTKETNSGSTTTHADYSLPEYDLFLFEIEPDQGKMTGVVIKNNLAKPRVHMPNVLTTHPTLMLDMDFILSDNSLPEYETFYFDIKEKNSGNTTIHADILLPDLERFNFKIKPDLGELTSIVDFGIRENVPSATNVNLPPEKDHSPLFAYVVCIFLSFLTNSWILKTHAKDFVHQSSLLQLQLGIIYSNLIELTFIFWHTL
nr:copia protein [Tanacetum cinerariifolium]